MDVLAKTKKYRKLLLSLQSPPSFFRSHLPTVKVRGNIIKF